MTSSILVSFGSSHKTTVELHRDNSQRQICCNQNKQLKVHLSPKFFIRYNGSTCYLKYFCEKNYDMDKSFLFCALTKSREYRNFCCMTESAENGSSVYCDVYPGRSNISPPPISLRMMQKIFEKYTETPSRGAIGCCSDIPDLRVCP